MEVIPEIVMASPMGDVCEDEALDMVEEEAFKRWLDAQGLGPVAFAEMTEAKMKLELLRLCQEWAEATDRGLRPSPPPTIAS